MIKRNHYEVLGVREDATPAEIRRAYLRLIQQLHPDRNPSSDAAERSATVNAAYSVLSDEKLRAAFDTSLRSEREDQNQSSADAREARPASASARPPDVRCAKCGRRDATLRLALMRFVVSLLVVTSRRGRSGVWCSRCRAIEAAKWTSVSFLAGWWGFPWGFIYTFEALWENSFGGEQPRVDNAALLRLVAYLLARDGNVEEAKAALDASLRLEYHEDAVEFAKRLGVTVNMRRRRDWWRFACATPTVAWIAAVAAVVVAAAQAPSGYESTYRPPQAVSHNSASALPQATPTRQSPNRTEINSLVEQLSAIVEKRAPVVGTHVEGTTVVTDHELDRSKFNVAELYRIADAISAAIEHQPSDPDGFAASSYFNARLFALSVDVLQRVRDGRPIRSQAQAVGALGDDPTIKAWLSASRYAQPYDMLVRRLDAYAASYQSGHTVSELELALDSGTRQLDVLKQQIEAHDRGDVVGYNALVDEHNHLADHLNTSSTALRSRAAAAQKLDLAFNECLDPGILLTRFNRVDLTSHSAEIDRLPEP